MPNEPRFRLRVKRIDTVGFVQRGDNPPAEIVFWKRREEPGGKDMDKPDLSTFQKIIKAIGNGLGLSAAEVDEAFGQPPNEGGEGDDVVKEFKLEDLPEVAQEEFAKLRTEAEKVEGLATEVADLTAKVKELTPEPDPEPEKVSAEVQKQLDDSEKRAKDAEERIAKLEGEKRHEEYVGKAAELTGIPGLNPDDHAETLDKIEEALGSEAFGKFFDVLKGAAAAVKAGDLFRVMGTGEAPLGTVEQEVTEAVAEVRKAKPSLTAEQARAEVWKNNHALYDRYEKERSDRVRTAEGR